MKLSIPLSSKRYDTYKRTKHGADTTDSALTTGEAKIDPKNPIIYIRSVAACPIKI